jgi:ubiquinone biosynthesis protein
MDYIAELEKLQDTAPELPLETVKEVVERELGSSLDSLYTYFSPQPLAAASLSQVHEAKLPNGRRVAVKVQRPGISQSIEVDMFLLVSLASRLERVLEIARLYNLHQVAKEIQGLLRNELDYLREGRNADRLREMFARHKEIFIPEIIWERTSQKVITMELLEGVKVSDVAELHRQGFDLPNLAKTLAQATLRQVYLHGFFHADPHPGNVWVRKDGTIAYLDFGMVGQLDQMLRDGLFAMFVSFADGDAKRYVEKVLELGIVPRNVDRQSLVRDIGRLFRQYRGMLPREVKVGQGLKEGLDMVLRYKVQPPPEMAILGKVYINLEGICQQLDSEFDFLSAAQPILLEALRQRLLPANLRAAGLEILMESQHLVLSAPKNLSSILDSLAEGRMHFDFSLGRLELLPQAFERAMNRMSLAFITGALFVGSALALLAGAGPHLRGYPVIAVLGFIAAMLMLVFLGLSMFASYRRW